jgi:hypothetical protein
MITLEETVFVNAQGEATVKMPPTVKPGAHRVVLHVDENTLATPNAEAGIRAPKAGCLKGIWMAPDFEAPLEDFREYTE